MNFAAELDSLKARGFSEDRAKIVVLIREAAVAIFRAFPDSFLLYGGANLILFHNSTRHSADLDLLALTTNIPEASEILTVLNSDLPPLAELLKFAPLEIQIAKSEKDFKKLYVSHGGRVLFTVDLTRMGSILNHTEEYKFESLTSSEVGIIKAASPNLLLLQKAEAFVLRKFVKARDAYDIKLLLDQGATLHTANLNEHLSDVLRWNELDDEQIKEKINLVDNKRCAAELKPVLPEDEFNELLTADFKPLRRATAETFKELDITRTNDRLVQHFIRSGEDG